MLTTAYRSKADERSPADGLKRPLSCGGLEPRRPVVRPPNERERARGSIRRRPRRVAGSRPRASIDLRS
eukprot:COSAG02_NODE_2636_length_8361_cov_6.129993_2_plen_69_part_00